MSLNKNGWYSQRNSPKPERIDQDPRVFAHRWTEHPIVPIMIYDAKIANQFASEMLNKGIYVIAFSYPVVPKDQARIRVQISAGHNLEQLNTAINAFKHCGEKYQII